MGTLLNRFKAAADAFRGKGSQPVLFPGSTGSFWLNGPRTSINYQHEVGRAADNSAVQACLGWIVDAWAEALPYVGKTKRGGGEDKLYDHQLVSLFENPNPHYSGQLLRDALLQDLLIDGTAYVRIMRDSYGIPNGLYWLPTNMMAPYWTETNEWIRYWEYTPQGQMQRLAVEDVLVWQQGVNPSNGGRTGYSRLKAALRDIYTDNEAANTVNAILKNRAQMGTVLAPDGRYLAELVKGGVDPTNAGYSKEVAGELETRVNSKFTSDGRGSTAVFSVPMSVTQFQSALKDLSDDTLRNISEERICAIFKLPPVVVGLGTGLENSGDRHNMETSQRMAWLNCVVPLQNQFARLVTEKLVPQFETGPYKFGFDRTGVEALQENTNERADRVVKLWQGDVLKHGEARSEMGYQTDPATQDLYYSEFTGGQPDQQQDQQLTDAAKEFKAKMANRWRGRV